MQLDLSKFPRGTFFLPIEPEMAREAGLDDPDARVRVYVEGRKLIFECVDDAPVHEI